ncbi:MAG: Gfo/Idh/MocA family oxidoreductase [Pirellulales bacterium]|nr:Gfo/Idh/MocA family oxidoreductase [Pirellulales bacterium]
MSTSWNRRRFLHAALSTSGAVASLSWAARRRAAQAEEAPAAPSSAADEIVLGIMGVANRGHQLAKAFAGIPGCRIAAICDVDERLRGKVAEEVTSLTGRPVEQVGDFRRLLDDQGVDALVCAAPDHWHAPATVLACAAGKHVYVEKPACHNGREGELMIAAARKHQRIVQMGTQRRSAPPIRQAIERLHAGEIGPARFARGWIVSTRPTIGRQQGGSPPAWLDYALWQGPAPEQPYRDNMIPYHWHWFWHWGTGELGNNGIHALDLCRWGLQVDRPRQVTSSGAKLFFQDDQQTPDTQLATFLFGPGGETPDKAIHWEHRTWNKRGFEDSAFGAHLYADGGSLVITSNACTFYDMDGKQLDRQETTSGENEHLADFLECVRTNRAPRAEIEIGVTSTLMCHLGNIAYRTGQVVKTDPATGRPAGNAEAEALWAREYRPGWEPQV